MAQNNTLMYCMNEPSKFTSPGILQAIASPTSSLQRTNLLFSFSFLELQLALIFIISHSFHYFLKRFGINLFASSIMTGIILGPTVLGRYEFMREKVFPQESQTMLNVLVITSLQILLFLSAVKMDARFVHKTGGKAMSIGASNTVFPYIASLFFINFVNEHKSMAADGALELFKLVRIQSVASFPVISYVFDELRMANSKIGRLGLSSALVGDMIALFIAQLQYLIAERNNSRDFIGFIAFLFVIRFMFRPLMHWIIRQTPQGMSVDSTYICLIMALIPLTGFYFSKIHQGAFVGPFILGLMVPAGPPLGSTLVSRFEDFMLGVLLPVQGATTMLRVDLLVVIHRFAALKFHIVGLILITSVKFAACAIPVTFCGLPFADSLILTIIMLSKGYIELTILGIMKDSMLFTEDVFAIAAIFVLVNSIVTPAVAKFLHEHSRKHARYQARTIASLRPDSPLRVLTCIYRPDNIDFFIRMLNSIYHTKESPVCVYVLHLIELIGRATPVFINHKKHKAISFSDSCSGNVVLSFNQYEQNNQNSVSVHNFTAISPANSMHEDLYTLAQRKLASLILIPLHRKWSGLIDFQNGMIRSLIRSSLESAPCSVGILFERTKNGCHNPKAPKGTFSCLGMIFIGGNDDREALALATRMAKNSFATLTIIHIVNDIADNDGFQSDEVVLNDMALEAAKQCAASDDLSLVYRKYLMKDGSHTAFLVRSLAKDFDLIIVGRRYGVESRQTAGLAQWSELPELGLIGDLLASKDLTSGASVLVVQQQQRQKRGVQ